MLPWSVWSPIVFLSFFFPSRAKRREGYWEIIKSLIWLISLTYILSSSFSLRGEKEDILISWMGVIDLETCMSKNYPLEIRLATMKFDFFKKKSPITRFFQSNLKWLAVHSYSKCPFTNDRETNRPLLKASNGEETERL